jgi:Family of unknown function (DUF5302)
MADNNDAKAKMLAALEAKKAKQGGGHKGNNGVAGGSKVQGGQRSGGAPQVQRKAGPSGSGAAG